MIFHPMNVSKGVLHVFGYLSLIISLSDTVTEVISNTVLCLC